MSRIAYVNGSYVPHGQAGVHIEDRGYQFGDGVYEVCEVRAGHMIDERLHMERLVRSLGEVRIRMPMTLTALGVVLRQIIRKNGVRNGFVYLQVTRGVARRDHFFPDPATPPAVVVTARHVDPAKNDALAQAGVSIITVPDNRWERVDIKTVGLLPNVLAKQAAREAGAREAWFVDAEGKITEGGSTNAWIVTQDGVLRTRHVDHGILKGITRTTLFEVAEKLQLRIEERPFTVAEALAAKEAFFSSATTIAMPVVRIDGQSIGDGQPGSVVKSLRALFHDIAEIAH